MTTTSQVRSYVPPGFSAVPAKSFAICSTGCLSVSADGARIGAYLRLLGLSESEVEDADLVIVMTCGFTGEATNRTTGLIAKTCTRMKPGAELWASGCLPAIKPESLRQFPIRRVLTNNDIDNLSFEKAPSSPSGNQENGVTTIRIARGCVRKCSYCAIRNAAGKLKSRPVSDLVLEVTEIDGEGLSHTVRLVGEDVGSYGKDIGSSLFDLTEAVLASTTKINLLIGAVHPTDFVADLDRYIRLFEDSRVVKRISIPIQSGSDSILQRMNRNYTVAEAAGAIAEFRRAVPDCGIGTDLIVGFPSETAVDFQASVDLLSLLEIDFLDVFRFDPQPQTKAGAFVGRIPIDETLRRQRTLCLLFARDHLNRIGVTGQEKLKTFLSDPRSCLPLNTDLPLRRKQQSPPTEWRARALR